MKSIALLVVVIITCITGWDYGFGLAAILSLFVGIEYENFTYNELLNNEFKGINSMNVSNVYHYKKGQLFLFLFLNFLIIVEIVVGIVFKISIPNWLIYASIILFIYNATYILSRYLAFSRYQNYLIKKLSEDD